MKTSSAILNKARPLTWTALPLVLSASIQAYAASPGLPEAVKSTGILTVATNAAYPPIEFFAEDGGTLKGLDIDLGNAIGKKLGVEAKFVHNGSFAGIIPGIQSGRYLMGMSSITDRADREQKVDFVDYANVGLGLLVQAGNPAHIGGLSDLCGKTLAVETGSEAITIGENQTKLCTSTGKPPVKVDIFPSQAQAQLQLRTGRADANMNDYPVVVYTAQASQGALEASPANFCAAPYGIAIAKNQPDLAAALQSSVDQLIASGEYSKVLTKWGMANSAITKSTINAASQLKLDPVCKTN